MTEGCICIVPSGWHMLLLGRIILTSWMSGGVAGSFNSGKLITAIYLLEEVDVPLRHEYLEGSLSFPSYCPCFQFDCLCRVTALHLLGSINVCVQVLSKSTFWNFQLSNSY